jgi:hypothetical protein
MASKLPRNIYLDPFLVPITPDEQKALTPIQILFSADARGMLPEFISQLLGTPGQRYYLQRDHGKTCLTRYTPNTHTPSEAEIATQLNFAAAVAAWQALTTEQKEVWNHDSRGEDRALPGYQLFLSEFLKGRI